MIAKASKRGAPFVWRGMDRRGKFVKGEMAAASVREVEARLRKMGVVPKRIYKQKAGGKVTSNDIAVFTRQLYTMLKAGVPMIQTFDIIAGGSTKPKAKRLALDIRDDINSGASMADAFRKFPQYFDNLYCNLVAAGELSGTLETMLNRLATYMEKSEALKRQIKSALMYPAVVIVAAIVATAITLIFVVPVFVEMFANFNAELPLLTQMVVAMSDFMVAYWLWILGATAVFGYIFVQSRKKNRRFRYWCDGVMLKLPIFGILVRKSCWARWAQTAATMFAAGVPLVDSLGVVAGASGNLVFEQATKHIQAEVAAGEALTPSMAETDLFPPMMLQMSTIGEESGQLEEMLDRVGTIYADEVDVMVEGLTSMLEPLMIIIVGALIGGIIIAMYLPIIKLGAAL